MSPGEVFGNYRVLEVSEKTYTIKLFGIKHPKEFNYLLCECTVCGARRLCRRQFLYTARAQDTKHCNKCTETTDFVPRIPTKLCGVCYDLPHCRPRVGLCRCGKQFEEEKLYYEECMINRSPIALAQGMI